LKAEQNLTKLGKKNQIG